MKQLTHEQWQAVLRSGADKDRLEDEGLSEPNHKGRPTLTGRLLTKTEMQRRWRAKRKGRG